MMNMLAHRSRRALVTVAVASASLTLVASVLSSGAAAASKAPKFSGPAPGSITCSVSAKVGFSPPLTHTGGGTSPSSIKAKLSACSPSNPAITIKAAKATGSFAMSPYSCVTMAATGAAPTLSVSWKANVNGTIGGTTYAGKASLTQTTVSGTSDTGSFAGTAALSLPVPTSAGSGCGSKSGIKKLTLTGTVTLGSSSSGPAPPNHSLWAWGYNGFGQLGDGSSTDHHNPEQIGTVTNWAQVSAGGLNFTVALKTDGSLWTWGFNNDGELGDGTTTGHDSPEQIGTDTNWAQVSAGDSRTLALKTDGTLWAWGFNGDGELGDGTTTGRDSPEQIGSETNWAQVSAGYNHSVAVKTDGTLWAWGFNGDGELGDGTISGPSCSGFCRTSPEQVGTDTNWAHVYAGVNDTLAIKTDGTLWAWGLNRNGDLGDGGTSEPSCGGSCIPGPEQIGTDTHWAQLSTGSGFTLAVKTDGTLWAWGTNDWGQLGDGTDDTGPQSCNGIACSTSPEQIGSDTTWTQVDSGYVHTVAVKTDGSLWAWGRNDFGQLGDGTNTGPQSCAGFVCSTSPERIGTDTNWARVSAGGYESVAVKQ